MNDDQSLGNRAYAADKYAASKDRRYRRIINDNNLPYGYKSLCMDTLGAFGTSLWSVIDRATDPNTHPKASGDYDPWRRPDPRRVRAFHCLRKPDRRRDHGPRR